MTTKILNMFHMIGGSMLIGYPINDNDSEHIVVEQPVNVLVQPGPSGLAVSLASIGFPLFQDAKKQPKTVTVNRSAVAFYYPLDNTNPEHKQMLEGHAQTFSSVILSTGGARIQGI